MKKIIFIFIIFVAVCSISAPSAEAASISFDTPVNIDKGENLDVVVNTDTDGVLINSIELVIAYNPDLLSFAGYSDENSVIKFWIDPPHATEGKIYLSGIIPGGVLGLYDAKKKGKLDELAPIPLFHLFFVAKDEGDAKFSFITSKILKHDGWGTPLLHEEFESQVIIKNNPNVKTTDIIKQENTAPDNIPTTQNSFNPAFWIILFIIISSIAGYKLLKYKV